MAVISSFNNIINQSHLEDMHVVENLGDVSLFLGILFLSLTVCGGMWPQPHSGWERGKPVIVSGLPTNEYISPPQRLSARSAPLEVGSLWAPMTRQLVSAQARSSLLLLLPSSGSYFSSSTWEK